MDWTGHKDDNNMNHHGTEEPPVYNPNHINTKVKDTLFLKHMYFNMYSRILQLALFYGDNDWLAAEMDVSWLYFQLPNCVESYKVKRRTQAKTLQILMNTDYLGQLHGLEPL